MTDSIAVEIRQVDVEHDHLGRLGAGCLKPADPIALETLLSGSIPQSVDRATVTT